MQMKAMIPGRRCNNLVENRRDRLEGEAVAAGAVAEWEGPEATQEGIQEAAEVGADRAVSRREFPRAINKAETSKTTGRRVVA